MVSDASTVGCSGAGLDKMVGRTCGESNWRRRGPSFGGDVGLTSLEVAKVRCAVDKLTSKACIQSNLERIETLRE